LTPEGTQSYILKTDEGNHWFLKGLEGEIIDLTADQFERELDYSKAKPKAFFKVPAGISKRGKILAEILGIQ